MPFATPERRMTDVNLHVYSAGCPEVERTVAFRALGARGPGDHCDQRTSQSPGIRQRAPFEHRNVHMRPTKDLVDRMCAGQRPATGAPPGTRTPNPRIKSRTRSYRPGPTHVRSCHFRRSAPRRSVARCRFVPFTCTATEHRWSTAAGNQRSIRGRGVCCVGRAQAVTAGPRLRKLSGCADFELPVHPSTGRRLPGSDSRPR
jgi:hypothetical protein